MVNLNAWRRRGEIKEEEDEMRSNQRSTSARSRQDKLSTVSSDFHSNRCDPQKEKDSEMREFGSWKRVGLLFRNWEREKDKENKIGDLLKPFSRVRIIVMSVRKSMGRFWKII